MIYIYGDSHGEFCFKNLRLPHVLRCEYSKTMHGVGKSRVIPKFDAREHSSDSIICFVFGEVDCRCHIKRQKDVGRDEDDIIMELVHSYFNTILQSIDTFKKIVIVGVIPPARYKDFPHDGPLPVLGTDEERVRFTGKVNGLMEELSKQNNFIYFNPHGYYTRDDGTFRYEFSDDILHLKDNAVFLERFVDSV
jgi:hypothetical protein